MWRPVRRPRLSAHTFYSIPVNPPPATPEASILPENDSAGRDARTRRDQHMLYVWHLLDGCAADLTDAFRDAVSPLQSAEVGDQSLSPRLSRSALSGSREGVSPIAGTVKLRMPAGGARKTPLGLGIPLLDQATSHLHFSHHS